MKYASLWLIMAIVSSILLSPSAQAMDERFAVSMTLLDPVTVTVSNKLFLALTSDQTFETKPLSDYGARLQLSGKPGTMITATIVADERQPSTGSRYSMTESRFIDTNGITSSQSFLDSAWHACQQSLHATVKSSQQHLQQTSLARLAGFNSALQKLIKMIKRAPPVTVDEPSSMTTLFLFAGDLSKNGQATFSEQGMIDNIRIGARAQRPVQSTDMTKNNIVQAEATLRIVF